MPIKVQSDLPARTILENENIFVMDEYRAQHQDMRPLAICILNLMPVKQDTELQLLRALSNTPLQIEITLLQTATHESKNVSEEHMIAFYQEFDQIKDENYDGMIITGAPVEMMPYEEVEYWDELCEIMEWSKTHVHSTFHICWGAQAGLYYHYGINKIDLPEKLSGIYKHYVLKKNSPLFRGFDDVFMAPQSRAMTVAREDIEKIPELELLAYSDEAGVTMLKTKDSRQFFMTCHPEYDSDTLAKEYYRDLDKGMNPKIPVNYFPDDDPDKKPVVNWRSTGQLFFSNWLNYYVYQTTPYDIKEI